MTESASTLAALIFGLGVFAVIVAVGWRSVQNRRILRLQGANGEETIIVAPEGDEVSSIVTSTTHSSHAEAPDAEQVPAAKGSASQRKKAGDGAADASAKDRLSRVVASTK